MTKINVANLSKKKTFYPIDFFKNDFMSSSSFSEKGKPRFSSYLKLQNISVMR